MLFSTIAQGGLFIWMMASGALIGLWYMLTALLRRFIQAGFYLGLACDLLFGAGAAFIFIAALVMGNHGRVRPFAVLGTLCGAALFALAVTGPLKTLRKAFLRAGRSIVAHISKNRLIKIIFK